MKHLVYAILREADAGNGPFPEGIESRPVVVVTDAGLAAAFSEVPVSDIAPEVPRLLAYARVIEALSRRRVVLPLRYGCLLDTDVQIRELAAPPLPSLSCRSRRAGRLRGNGLAHLAARKSGGQSAVGSRQ